MPPFPFRRVIVFDSRLPALGARHRHLLAPLQVDLNAAPQQIELHCIYLPRLLLFNDNLFSTLTTV